MSLSDIGMYIITPLVVLLAFFLVAHAVCVATQPKIGEENGDDEEEGS